MCLQRAPEKYIEGAKAPAGAALDRAGLRHELSSPAITLSSWFSIPFEVSMFLYVSFVSGMPCVRLICDWVILCVCGRGGVRGLASN
jgi:hypothetical protein